MEYSVSATLMVLLIASYSGITDITAIVAIAGANVAMILFGWLQERMNPPGRTSTTMMPFWFGTIAGVAPWVAIWVNLIGAPQVPGFVYGIVIAQVVFFFSFGLNQWLQYRGVGRWRNYAYGEKTYLVLSLVREVRARLADLRRLTGRVIDRSAMTSATLSVGLCVCTLAPQEFVQ